MAPISIDQLAELNKTTFHEALSTCVAEVNPPALSAEGCAPHAGQRERSSSLSTSTAKLLMTSPIATPSSPSQNGYGSSLSTTESSTPSSFVLLGERSLRCSVSKSANSLLSLPYKLLGKPSLNGCSRCSTNESLSLTMTWRRFSLRSIRALGGMAWGPVPR